MIQLSQPKIPTKMSEKRQLVKLYNKNRWLSLWHKKPEKDDYNVGKQNRTK